LGRFPDPACVYVTLLNASALVAKDRPLGDNPCVALYTTGSYYARMRRKGF
jgi:hypothetical protein